MTQTTPVIKRALISTSNKTGVVDFAQQLHELNISILATGGTARLLSEHNIPITQISEYTQFPEIMGGRVKTLHPKIYGGLLSRGEEDAEVMDAHEIDSIDLVVVNLYPFEKVTQQEDVHLDDAIENIDIGGPSMIRAAAKNYRRVAVVTDPDDYGALLKEISINQSLSLETREHLAFKAFQLVCRYNHCIATYFDHRICNQDSEFNKKLQLTYFKHDDLRYGENPHQRAALYQDPSQSHSLAHATPVQGKALSYNNLLDADCALSCVSSLPQPACVIVKHASPCGVALGENTLSSYQKALAADAQSAFGGIVACNTLIDEDTAQAIVSSQFAEVVIAPDISEAALACFQQKPKLRVLMVSTDPKHAPAMAYHSIQGGLLVQEYDNASICPDNYQVPTVAQVSDAMIHDAALGDKIVRFVKSNAIVLINNQQSIGIGPGQPSRIKSTEIAIQKAMEAGFDCKGATMASDAFFPFPDCIELAAKAGIQCVIQPGGSIKDQAVIDRCNDLGITMIMTGQRHFRH